MNKLKENYNLIVSTAAQEISEIIMPNEDFNFDEYDQLFELVERSLSDNSIDNPAMQEWFDLGISDDQAVAIIDILKDAREEFRTQKNEERKLAMKENTMTSFEKIYECGIKYASKDADLDDVQDKAEIRKPKDAKAAINGLPNFDYDDGGFGPIPTTGVGRRDYEAKYSKTGKLVEGVISPALREATELFEARRHLIENRLIDKADLDLLEEDLIGDGEVYDGETFRPEAEKITEVVGENRVDVEHILSIMNDCHDVEEAISEICDRLQLDSVECYFVNKILNEDTADATGVAELIKDAGVSLPVNAIISIIEPARDVDEMIDALWQSGIEDYEAEAAEDLLISR